MVSDGGDSPAATRVPAPGSRRERLRTATVAEIKATARKLLVEGGPHAISLRAIARAMGMTAPAIYRYFDSLDALVFELTGDYYDELREAVEAARDRAADRPPMDRLVDMARGFRSWSVTHPAEFALMFGNPLPGVVAFEKTCHDLEHAGARFGGAFIEVFREITPPSDLPTPPTPALEHGLRPHLDPLAQIHGELPLPLVFVYLDAWVRLYGLVAMEVFGHLRWALTDVEALFELELAAFVHQLTSPT